MSTIVPESTYAPIFTYDGISTVSGAIYEPRRAVAGGTTRTPLALNSSGVMSANFEGTLS